MAGDTDRILGPAASDVYRAGKRAYDVARASSDRGYEQDAKRDSAQAERDAHEQAERAGGFRKTGGRSKSRSRGR